MCHVIVNGQGRIGLPENREFFQLFGLCMGYYYYYVICKSNINIILYYLNMLLIIILLFTIILYSRTTEKQK